MKSISRVSQEDQRGFKYLPSNWNEVKLKEISNNIQYGYTASSTNDPIGPRFLRITDIQDNKVIWDKVPFCSIEEDKKKRYLLKVGDLVFARTGATVGKSYLLKGQVPESVFASYLIKVELNNRISNEFVYYFFQSLEYWKQITEGQVGIGQPNVNGTKLSNLLVPLPPLPEQRAIVSKIEQLFSELDNGIANLKLAQEQLKVYRQAVLKQAFTGELTRKWREEQTDLPDADELLEEIRREREKAASDSGKKVKTVKLLSNVEIEIIHDIPKNWKWIKIGNITLGVEYGTSAKSEKSGEIPVLRMGNIQNGIFDWSDLVYSNNKEEIKKYLLKINDVLFNRTNSPELVGKTAIYLGDKPAIFAGYLIRVNQIPTLIDSKFLNYYLNSHSAKVHGSSVKTDGVNQSNINGEKLGNYPFPYCSVPEQQAIVTEIETRLSVCDKLEQDITDNLKKAEYLRQSILKQAFEGKLLSEQELIIVRNDPEWEPAEALLARIKSEKSTR